MSDEFIILTAISYAVLVLVLVFGIAAVMFALGRKDGHRTKARDARLIQEQREIIARYHEQALDGGAPVAETERIAHDYAVIEQNAADPRSGRHARPEGGVVDA